ncbi:MAG: hypothetical protein AAGF95_33295 [Chloroflexota bacterium]
MAQHPIMIAFQFTPDDVMANRTGYATPKQTYQQIQTSVIEILFIVFLGSWTLTGAFFSIVALFMFVLLFGAVLSGFTDMAGIPYELAGILLFPLFIVVGSVYAILYIIRRVLQKRQDRRTRIVHRVSGSIILERREGDEVDTYFLHVSGEKLKITEQQYYALNPYQNTNWYIYYFPLSKTIASLEHW